MIKLRFKNKKKFESLTRVAHAFAATFAAAVTPPLMVWLVAVLPHALVIAEHGSAADFDTAVVVLVVLLRLGSAIHVKGAASGGRLSATVATGLCRLKHG